MNFKEEYKKKLITLDEAILKVKSNYEIGFGLGAAEASGFLSNLHKIKDKVHDVSVITCLNQYPYKFCTEEGGELEHFINNSFFFSGVNRKAHALKKSSLIPNHLHFAGTRRLSFRKPNIFVASVSPMDKHGNFSLSLSLMYERDYIENADIVILEVNHKTPRTYGDTNININEVDFVYEYSADIPQLKTVELKEKDLIIGDFISELVEDGSTIQLGIGGIPNAVAKSLENKKDLGIHTEMFTDGMVDLYYKGAITNKKKTLHPDKFVAAFALGTKKLYDFLDDNTAVLFKRGSYTNDPYIIGKNHKMVSINTTLQVDLGGQCCSESIGSRQYSATGGQADTAIGSQLSKGGKSIIALHSTVKDDTVSTIVPTLYEGAVVSLSRNDVDYVVTEYGVAHLKGKSIGERVKELIKIAHPNFREDLKKQAMKNYMW